MQKLMSRALDDQKMMAVNPYKLPVFWFITLYIPALYIPAFKIDAWINPHIDKIADKVHDHTY